MVTGKVVTYFRVSSQAQGRSGLGLEAQAATVKNYLSTGKFEVVGSFAEVETGGGANALEKRPQLRAALELAKKQKATLVIAALSRLARNVHFISGLLETGVPFIDASMPSADRFMIQIYSVMAEMERTQLSTRTKLALQAAKARGVKLGRAGFTNLQPVLEAREQAANEFASGLSRVVRGFIAEGLTQRAIADELNRLQIRTARGCAWSQTQVHRLITRINGLQQEEIKLAA